MEGWMGMVLVMILTIIITIIIVITTVLYSSVYSNGNELQQAKRVTLTRPMLQRWDAILEEVTNKVGNLTTW